MTLREQIEAASAKATQGVWAAESEGGDEWYFGNSRDGMETVIRGPGEEPLAVMGGNDNANLVLVTLLVNAYRAGKLLVIEDEQEAVRDMLARAYSDGATAVHECWINDGGQWDADFGEAASDYAIAKLPAALAALKGEV